MLNSVKLKPRNFEEYRPIIDPKLFAEVVELAGRLKGKRLLQINSTATFGGVAEILASTAPLLTDLGLAADWQVIDARPGFFAATKAFHNGLQGSPINLEPAQWQLYEMVSRELADGLNGDDWDYIIVHDPQPLAIRHFMKRPGKAKWIWRYHGDSSLPNPDYLRRLLDYLALYDGAIFSLKDYVPAGLHLEHIATTPVAIDPLNMKNLAIDQDEAHGLVAEFGIDLNRPLITQISRFDPWKDPIGVVQAWQLARQHVPGLQLALVGNMAGDDPQAGAILAQVRDYTKDLKDVFVLANNVGQRASRAFLQTSQVILQKSLREGFGLTVSEALWAGAPVIGGNVGGIRIQIEDGQNGYLVDSVEQAAERIVELVGDPTKAQQMGQCGREIVRQHFLIPRLIRDDLKFLLEL